jgi:psiF repeat
MIRFTLSILIGIFAVASAAAQAPDTCANKAVGKHGKELHGAARTSFMAKCKRDACAPKAIGSDGKALKGAARRSFMDKCLREQA